MQGWYPTRPLDDEIVALTCRTFTDILVVGHASAPGITTDFDTEAREAAWTSFSELLVSAASDLLMVERRELEVGIRRTFVDNKKKAEIFLADALENGAGYALELARLPRFRELMKLILDDGLADRFAEHRCDSACYLCLKNYENMRSHGILDWRLALDLANVIAARPFPDRRAFAIEQASYFCEMNKKSGFWSEEETWTSEVVGGIPVLSGGKAVSLSFPRCSKRRRFRPSSTTYALERPLMTWFGGLSKLRTLCPSVCSLWSGFLRAFDDRRRVVIGSAWMSASTDTIEDFGRRWRTAHRMPTAAYGRDIQRVADTWAFPLFTRRCV